MTSLKATKTFEYTSTTVAEFFCLSVTVVTEGKRGKSVREDRKFIPAKLISFRSWAHQNSRAL